MKKKITNFFEKPMLLISTCILFGLYKFVNIIDPDYFFHFYTGKYIIDNKIIPKHDIFSWVSTNARWYTPSWAFDVLTYIIKDLGITILLSILVFFLIRILSKIFFKGDKTINFIKYLIFISSIIIIMPYIQHRPTIFSFLFFAYTIYILYLFLTNEKNKKIIYTLPIIQILWVNFHGASSSLMYIIIFIIIFINIFTSFSFRNIEHKRLSKEKFKNLFIVLVLVLLGTLINPNTYEIFKFVFGNFTNSYLFISIAELQSPKFNSISSLATGLLPMILILLTFLFNKEKKYELHDLILISMFICMYFKGIRFYPYLITVLLYFLNKYLEFDLIKIPINKMGKNAQIFFVNSFSILILSYFLVFSHNSCSFGRFRKPLTLDSYISDELQEKLIEIKPKRLANAFNDGSALSYIFLKNEMNSKVFINGLAEIYINTDIFKDYNYLYVMKKTPEDIIDKYEFDYILVDSTSPLFFYLVDKPLEYETVFIEQPLFKNHLVSIYKVLKYAY